MFPYVPWQVDAALEIGSGMGFIMQAFDRASSGKSAITGLDISQTMIEAAKARLGASGGVPPNFSFSCYDGITMPFGDQSFDLVYSIAALQHIPKPYVYNLFFEIRRVLRPGGYAVLHFLPFAHLPQQEVHRSWRVEITSQITDHAGPHWHHFYSKDELQEVLTTGTDFAHVDIRNDIYACASKTAVPMRKLLWRDIAGLIRR